ncbi:MAG: hypothetical protein IPK25_07385 [Saprospiraceae bacterium]|nr:hypothetical protein [Saprospiraceae bacterium]
MGINKATFTIGASSMEAWKCHKLKELGLREENAKLKRMYADQALMLEMAKDVISKSGKAFRQKNDRNLPCEKI